MGQYIPDLTERFPEGFRGIDMTPSYFGEPVDWSDPYGYCEDVYEEPMEPRKFELGKEYKQVGIYGGVTYYTVEEIDRKEGKVLLSEVWVDVDGTGTRPAEWHKLAEDENGEIALDWVSREYGDIWIYA
jgi:hypothetical protein